MRRDDSGIIPNIKALYVKDHESSGTLFALRRREQDEDMFLGEGV